MYTAKQIAERFNDVKTVPHVAMRVSRLANDECTTMQEFENVIKHDPILVTRLLRLVNSPYFGLSQKIDSITKAIIYAGIKNLRNLVAVEAIRDLFNDEGDDFFSRKKLWFHSAVVAILGEMIAKRIWGLGGEDVFLAGVIHDLGLVAVDQVTGKELREACHLFNSGGKTFPACERQVFGTDHCEVGVVIASDWGLPGGILETVASHHRKSADFSPTTINGMIQIAEFLAGKMGHSPIQGLSGSLHSQLAEHVKERSADYKVILKDSVDEISKASEFVALESE